MNIRLANKEDLKKVEKLYKDVVEDLLNVKHIETLWDNVYPFCHLEDDILNSCMYVLTVNCKIIGAFVLEAKDDPDYEVLRWTCNENFFYISRLAILPSEQGKGYAKSILNFIDEYAKNKKYDAIRLTVSGYNNPAISLYEKLGFKKVDGSLEWKNVIFLGYEKLI